MRTAAVTVTALWLFAISSPLSKAQHNTAPIGCQGLSDEECDASTKLLRAYLVGSDRLPAIVAALNLSENPFGTFPRTWRIVSDDEFLRISDLYQTREGHWLSSASSFVLFLEPDHLNGMHCAPTEVVLRSTAVSDPAKMIFIAGYFVGACESFTKFSLAYARSPKNH